MLEAGSVFTRLGFRFDDSGADRFERRERELRRKAAKPIVADAKVDVDKRSLDRFDRNLDQARRSARRPITAKLEANDDSRREVGRFGNALERIRDRVRRPFTAKLKADVDRKGFRDYDRQLDGVDRGHGRVERSSGRMKGGLLAAGKGAGAMWAAVGGAGAALAAKSFVDQASDINESLTKNQVLFGDAAKDVDEWSKGTARSLGISRSAALEYTGTFGNLFRALGETKEASAGYSKDLVKLSADMASFNNSTPEEALEAIRSGLVGETEPLRRFGVNMNDATLRAEALKQGLIKNEKEALTPQQKALAATALITKQTAAAHGDFARTSGGLANQTRILKARFADVSAELGAKLLPVALAVTKGLVSFIDLFDGGGPKVEGFSGKVSGFGGTVRKVFDGLKGYVANFVALWTGIGKALADVFGGEGGRGFASDAKKIADVIGQIAAVWLSVYNSIAKRAIPGIVTAVKGLALIIRGIVRVIAGILTLDFAKAWAGVKDIFGGAVRVIGGILRAASAPFRAAAALIGRGIRAAFDAAWDLIAGVFRAGVRNIVKAVRDTVSGARAAATAVGRAILNPVVNFVEALPRRIASFFAAAVRAVRNAVSSATSAAVRVGTGIANGVASAVSRVPGRIAGFFGAAARRIAGTFNSLFQAAYRVGSGIVNGIASALASLPGRVASIGASAGRALWDAFKGAAGKVLGKVPGFRARGGLGGVLGAPTVIVAGEEAPQHPEFYISTNPRDKTRSKSLVRSLVEGYLGGRVEFFAAGGTYPGGVTNVGGIVDNVIKKAKTPAHGIKALDRQIATTSRMYEQADRQFALSEETYIDPDTGQRRDTDIGIRMAEIDKLVAAERAIEKLMTTLRGRLGEAISKGKGAIRRWEAALKKIHGKSAKSKRRRAALKRNIARTEKSVGEWGERKGELEFEITDQGLDIGELLIERGAVAGTAAEDRSSGDTGAGDTGGGGDVGADPGEPPPSAPSAEDIARAAAEQFAAFTAGRASLFSSFGANFARSGGVLFADPMAQAAGTRYFGAGDTGGSGGGAGVREVTINQTFGGAPDDPDQWVAGVQTTMQGASLG